MAINDSFKMVSSNLNHTLVSNKSRIPIKVYQLSKAGSIVTNFKSSSSFNVTKIPKLVKHGHKVPDNSTLSTNTFSVPDKLLKERKQYKRSTSFNTESNTNVSSLSDKSQLSSSSQSEHSVASRDRNSQDLVKYIKKKLKEMEKRPTLDELSDVLAEEARTIGHKKVTVHTLDTLRLKYNSKSLSNSQLSHTKARPVPEANKNTIELFFANLKHIDQLFKSAQRELFDKALTAATTSKTNRYRLKLRECMEKFTLVMSDKDSGNIGLLSPESYAFAKQDVYKNGEFVLRLVADLVFKFRMCLKLYTRIIGESGKTKLPSIGKKEAANKATLIQNSIDNLNESFIKETDCSSIVSDDEDEHNQQHSHSHSHSHSQTNSPTHAPSHDQIDNYNKLKKKILYVNEDLNDLNMYLDSLNSRAERCAKLEDQLKSEKEMIKKAEVSLRLCDQAELKRHLEKQLEFLRYKFKINLQDYNIEKICAPEIYTAISDTEFKIFKLNSYLKDLNKSLFYIESKKNTVVKKTEPKNQQKQHLPRHLPPLHQFKDLALKQFN